MKNLFLILASIILLSCNGQQQSIFVIDKGFCGKVIIIPNQATEFTKKIIVDSSGICYVSKDQFSNSLSKKMIKEDRDITDKCKIFEKGYITLENGDKFEFASFYVPCANEFDKDDNYWQEKSSHDFHKGIILKLIKEGKIKI